MKPPPDLRQIIAQMNRSKIIVASYYRVKTASLIEEYPRHLIEAVKALHFRTALEIHGLLRDSEDFCIDYSNDEESPPKKINVEKMVQMLPKHLMAVHMSDDRGDRFEYILCGIRLIQTFCDLAPRHTKLDEVLLDDVRVAAQMLDLVFLVIMNVAANRRERGNSDKESLIDATLVASSLYLMHGFISPVYSDLVQVLLAHPRCEVFIDCAFGAVHNVVRSLKAKLLYRQTDPSKPLGAVYVAAVNVHCQQAEAALQFLHSMCLHKSFRDRVAKNKEICRNGGALMLAQTILSLAVTPEFVGASVPVTIASISRMKAKALSILHQLFEAENVSFLDEVADAGKLHLAKNIASEVLSLLRLGLSKASKCKAAAPDYPMGFVLLNAMRVADVFTDDSNFRSVFIENLSMVLSAIFCLSHGDFLSMLCSSNISSKEDEANVDYDLFASTGWVLSIFSSLGQLAPPQFKLNLQSNLTMSSYAHQRSSFVIKLISNLHCFVPNFCKEEERNRFITNFVSGLRKDPSSILVNMLPSTSYTPEAQRGTGVSKNLGSLLRHAESLIPSPVNEQDYLLFRVFCDQCQQLLRSEFKESQVQVKDIQGMGVNPFGKQHRREPLNINSEEASENYDVQIEDATKGVNGLEIGERSKESDVDANNIETSGSDISSNRGKNRVEDGELVQTIMSKRSKGSVSGEVKAETFLVFEKQRKKRKRSIMNDDQMRMIEIALADEPDMQRNSASIQLWADKLSQNGTEVITSSQLKNWLNNRKAKLARANKQTGQVRDNNNNSSGDLPDSPGDENTCQQKQSAPFKDQTATRSPKTGENLLRSSSSSEERQQVMLMNDRGDEIGKGIVVRTNGEWYGFNLETKQVCVVDVMELNGSYDWSKMMIPYGSDDVGRTFEEANSRFGVMRVAWDVNKLQYHQTLVTLK